MALTEHPQVPNGTLLKVMPETGNGKLRPTLTSVSTAAQAPKIPLYPPHLLSDSITAAPPSQERNRKSTPRKIIPLNLHLWGATPSSSQGLILIAYRITPSRLKRNVGCRDQTWVVSMWRAPIHCAIMLAHLYEAHMLAHWPLAHWCKRLVQTCCSCGPCVYVHVHICAHIHTCTNMHTHTDYLYCQGP